MPEQRRLLERIRILLDERAGPEQITDVGSRRFGVTAIFIEDGSDVDRRVPRRRLPLG